MFANTPATALTFRVVSASTRWNLAVAFKVNNLFNILTLSGF